MGACCARSRESFEKNGVVLSVIPQISIDMLPLLGERLYQDC